MLTALGVLGVADLGLVFPCVAVGFGLKEDDVTGNKEDAVGGGADGAAAEDAEEQLAHTPPACNLCRLTSILTRGGGLAPPSASVC